MGRRAMVEARAGFWRQGGGEGGLVFCTKVRKRWFVRRGQYTPCSESLRDISVDLWAPHKVVKRAQIPSHPLLFGWNRNKDAFLSKPISKGALTLRRESSSLRQLSLWYVEYIISLWPTWCSLIDCCGELLIFPWVGPDVMFLMWNAESEREDSKTTVLMLLGPFEKELKVVPVGLWYISQVCWCSPVN